MKIQKRKKGGRDKETVRKRGRQTERQMERQTDKQEKGRENATLQNLNESLEKYLQELKINKKGS